MKKRILTLALSAALALSAVPAGGIRAKADNDASSLQIEEAHVTAARSITEAQVYLSFRNGKLEYNGKVQVPQVTVRITIDGTVWILEEGTDYTLSFPDSVDAGSYQVTITGIGDYSGSRKESYKIEPTMLSSSWVKLSSDTFTYDGKEKRPTVTVNAGQTTLVEGTDYTLTYSNNIAAGANTAKVIVEGKGNYTEKVTKSFSITSSEPVDVGMVITTIPTATAITYGAALSTSKLSNGVAKYNDKVMGGAFAWEQPNVKPAVSDSNKTEYGVVFTPANSNYDKAYCKVKITVNPKKLDASSMSLSSTKFTYDGTAKKPTVTVMDGSKTVDSGEYAVAYKNNTAVGTATVTVTDRSGGNYEVNGTLTFSIISDHDHTLVAHSAINATCTTDGKKAYWECPNCHKIYSDAQGKTEVTADSLVIKASGHKLTAHSQVNATCTTDGKKAYWDCSVCKKLFSDSQGKTETNENSLVIKAAGHKFTHVGAKEATVYSEGNIEYWYCSTCGKYYADAAGTSEITKAQTVLPKSEHKLTLIPEKKPTTTEEGNIAYYSCSHCGKLFTDAEAKNEISPESVRIAKLKSIEGASVSGLSTVAWSGAEMKPAVTVKLGTTVLKNGTDYEVTYSNNSSVGTALVTITGKGEYGGTIVKKFLIKKASLRYRAYVQKKNWMEWSTASISGTEASKMAGTTDNLRMETIQMQLSGISGAVEYRAYVEKMGWTQWATTADKTTYAGTKGKSRRVEMIQLKATGQVAKLYDMYYRAYSENFGWLGWAKSGEKAGSAGYARKLEAFQVNFVRKGESFKLTSDKTKCFYDKTKDGANP